MKKILFIFSALICVPCFANDCLSYKITPTVDMSLPEYETNIVISKQPLEQLHGHVSANLINNYELVLDMYPNGNGFCASGTVSAIFTAKLYRICAFLHT